MNIVVAEDDDFCAQFITRALGEMATGPIQRVETLKQLFDILRPGIDAIWLDLSLKDSVAENTLEIGIRKIREICPSTTLIVASGWGDQYRDQALAAGADAYAGKHELKGFNQAVIIELLTRAAMAAMARGADANMILECVARLVKNTAASET